MGVGGCRYRAGSRGKGPHKGMGFGVQMRDAGWCFPPCFVSPGNQPTVLESAEAFHPEKNKWESLPPMPTPRCACSSIVVRNCLLAVGGVSQGLSNAVEALCVSDS